MKVTVHDAGRQDALGAVVFLHSTETRPQRNALGPGLLPRPQCSSLLALGNHLAVAALKPVTAPLALVAL